MFVILFIVRNLHLRRSKRNYSFLLLSVLFLIITGYILCNFAPKESFNLKIIKIPVLIVFLLSLSGFIFSLTTFILVRKMQGAIFTTFVLLYIFLRVAGLTHFIFLIILIVILIFIEIIIYKERFKPKSRSRLV